MIYAVTGATGLVGKRLCERLAGAGAEVRALVRRSEPYPFDAPGIRLHRCDLPDEVDRRAFDGADATIHCAYTTRFTDLESARRVNEVGTERVLALSREANVPRFVFLSSQSAHAAARSYYGRSKLRLEGLLSPADVALRSGLVLSPTAAGLFGRMLHVVRTAKVVPLFGGGGQPIQTIHVEDLATVVESALARRLGGVVSVSEPGSVTIRALLEKMARRIGRRVAFVPFPMGPALVAARAAERLRIPLPFSSENLLGLEALRAFDTGPDLERLGVHVRSLDESLADVLG
jgi:nucleoside-diphosphate-sugar epimerase